MNDTDLEKIEKLFNPRINNKGDYVTVTLPGTGTTVELMYEEFMALRDTFAALVARREAGMYIKACNDYNEFGKVAAYKEAERLIAALTTEATQGEKEENHG